jgi:hypothetical protein
MATIPFPALTLEPERRLRAIQPQEPRTADRLHALDLTGEHVHHVPLRLTAHDHVQHLKDSPTMDIGIGEPSSPSAKDVGSDAMQRSWSRLSHPE